jgi:hypothetical protein
VYIDSRGAGSTGVRVTILHDRVIGVVAYANRTNMYNSALLVGGTISSSVGARVCHACRRAALGYACEVGCRLADPSEMTCSSLNATTVIGLSGCTAFLSPLQSTPSRNAIVTVAVANSSIGAAVSFVTWSPELPVSIAVSRTTLRPVRGVGVTLTGGSLTCAQVGHTICSISPRTLHPQYNVLMRAPSLPSVAC